MIDVQDKACPCCHGQLPIKGEDRSEHLDVVPTQIRVELELTRELPTMQLHQLVGQPYLGVHGPAAGQNNVLLLGPPGDGKMRLTMALDREGDPRRRYSVRPPRRCRRWTVSS